MNRWLLLISLLCFFSARSQQYPVYLHVKKGYHKKATYSPGDLIRIKLKNNLVKTGAIVKLDDSTVYLNKEKIALHEVAAILLPVKTKKPYIPDVKTMAWVTGGAALATAGLTWSGQADFKEALTAGLVLGYGPILVQMLRSRISFQRKQYRIRKKFRLQVYDLSPLPRAF